MNQSYRPGEIINCRVRHVYPSGVYVMVDGCVEGYIRRRELTLSGDVDPRKAVKEDEELRAMVMESAAPGRWLPLSVRETLPDPWPDFLRTYRVGDVIPVTVKHLLTDGVRVEHKPGIDGIIPLSEMVSDYDLTKPEEALWTDDQTEASIIYLDPVRRRLLLSIRRWIKRRSMADDVLATLRRADTDSRAEWPIPREQDRAEQIVLSGPLLIVEDQVAVRKALMQRLGKFGLTVIGAESAAEALVLCENNTFAGAFIDLDMPTVSGLALIQELAEAYPDLPVAVMSGPEVIADRASELADLGIITAFAKPLDEQEILDCLRQLARGETPQFTLPQPAAVVHERGYFAPATTLNDGESAEVRLQRVLTSLVDELKADLGVVFHLDLSAWSITIVAQDGPQSLPTQGLYFLTASPVKDLIMEGGYIAHGSVSADRSGRYRNLLALLPFESIIGWPLEACGRVEHALFLFSRQPNAFGPIGLRDAHAAARLLQSLLEGQALETRILSISRRMLSGELASAFGHEVYNQLTALESQILSASDAISEYSDNRSDEPVLIESLMEARSIAAKFRQEVRKFQGLMLNTDSQEVDVEEVLGVVLDHIKPLAYRYGVELSYDAVDELPLAAANDIRLQHVFLNLLLNAIQHTNGLPDRQGRLDVRVATAEAGGQTWVRLQFIDNGLGIHRRQWESVFAFGFTTREDGSGLGLYIARNLLESMGGRIYIQESRKLLGTTFVVELPVARMP